jgi:hypothetical protein
MSWNQKSEAEFRRVRCETLYLLEMEFREMGEGDLKLTYDEEHDLFRFRSDGRFAFSRKYADWGLLRKRGVWDGPSSQTAVRFASLRS